ncbi:Multidrug resistance protein MdtG [Frigidibacter albus]
MPAVQPRLALTFILLTVAINSIGVGLIFPVMPDLLEEVTGGTVANAALWGGVLATAYAAMQFVFGPIVGNLSDRYGRRPVLLSALAVMTADYLLMSVAHTVWLLLVGRVIAGITAATHAAAGAYIADISAPDERAKNFGLIGAAFGVGFVAGPLIGGLLAGIDTRAPFYAAAAMAAANLCLGWVVLPETVTDAIRRPFSWARANPLASFRAIGRLPGLQRMLLVLFVYSVGFHVYPVIWSFYGKARFGWDDWMIGLSLAAFGLCIALVQALLVGPAIRQPGGSRRRALGHGGRACDLPLLRLRHLGRAGAGLHAGGRAWRHRDASAAGEHVARRPRRPAGRAAGRAGQYRRGGDDRLAAGDDRHLRRLHAAPGRVLRPRRALPALRRPDGRLRDPACRPPARPRPRLTPSIPSKRAPPLLAGENILRGSGGAKPPAVHHQGAAP